MLPRSQSPNAESPIPFVNRGGRWCVGRIGRKRETEVRRRPAGPASRDTGIVLLTHTTTLSENAERTASPEPQLPQILDGSSGRGSQWGLVLFETLDTPEGIQSSTPPRWPCFALLWDRYRGKDVR